MTDAKELDPDTLRTAIECARDVLAKGEDGPVMIYSGWLSILHKAGSAHLATLPREVPIAGWTLVHNHDGTWSPYLYPTEYAARDAAGSEGGVWQPVRLTGTALLEGKK